MNQKRAKSIRRKIYGDDSQREVRYSSGSPRICLGNRGRYRQEKHNTKSNH